MTVWRIWYPDGSALDCLMGEEWPSVPDGMVGLVAFFGTDEYGRRLGEFMAGAEQYWMSAGVVGYGDEPPDGAIVKSGGLLPEDWGAIRNAMTEWAVNG